MENISDKQNEAITDFLNSANKTKEYFDKKRGCVSMEDKEWAEHVKVMSEKLDISEDLFGED